MCEISEEILVNEALRRHNIPGIIEQLDSHVRIYSNNRRNSSSKGY